MDTYEKKYNEALERAKSIHNNPNASKSRKEWIEDIFPELRESEDERIRKEIIDFLETLPASELKRIPRPISQWFTWLEKQKEHQFCSDAPKEKSVGGDFLSSHKDKNLDEIAQDYVDGVKEYNPEPTWDLMQTAVCYGYHLAEQKPAEIAPNQFDGITYGMQGCSTEKSAERFEEAREKYQVEWSEEDEKIITRLIDYLESFRIVGVTTKWEGLDIQEVITLLKSLRPRHKQDKGPIAKFVQAVEDAEQHRKGYEEGLRDGMKRHWKPSEEQMKALKEVAYSIVGTGTQTDVYLVQLYEQLKKLM